MSSSVKGASSPPLEKGEPGEAGDAENPLETEVGVELKSGEKAEYPPD